MAMPDFQPYLCVSMNKMAMLNILKQVIFDCGLSSRVTCAFKLQKNISELSELNTLNL